MKTTLLTGLALIAAVAPAAADITVKVSPDVKIEKFDIEYGLLADMAKPRGERPSPLTATKTPVDGVFTIETLQQGAAQYAIPLNEREYIVLYTSPGDNLNVDLTAVSPLSYSVTGTQLMTDISALDSESDKILGTYHALMAAGNPNPETVARLNAEYNKLFTDYIAANPDAAAVPYAILHLEGQDFLNAYDNMSEAAATSPIAILLTGQRERVEKQLAMERHKAELTSGNVMAPDFTFNDAEGKPVSLSSFLGKWVIIDFWGTWCPWCIKGFPELKEAYKEYKPELEIIGVACNDEYDAWLKGIKKYDLPWVNVYNPEKGGGQLAEDYAIEGFPTKALINPEGVIVNITTGHNPEFFNILKEKMGK